MRLDIQETTRFAPWSIAERLRKHAAVESVDCDKYTVRVFGCFMPKAVLQAFAAS